MALTGKRALVTGGSRGIGRGIVLKLAEQGAAVAINYVRDAGAAEDTLAKVRSLGADGFTVQADVSRPEEVGCMLQRVKTEFGGLDIFVSNALGDMLGFFRPPMETSLEQWDAAFGVQARAFLVGVQQATPLMGTGGRVFAISYYPGSHAGGFLPYFAMGTNKAALEAMCRYFAVALAPRGITVNAICPGITDDSILNALPQAVQDQMLGWLRRGWTPMGRPGTPADIGNAITLLAAEEAAWITGQTIVVDGGASLMNPEVPLEFQRAG
jgi:NAD(P)-dependent dehydrogenase (short-subunit alcohol dehydrogenase family)